MLGKTAETLRGLGGALGCSCPSEPLKVTPPPAGTQGTVHMKEFFLLVKEKLGMCSHLQFTWMGGTCVMWSWAQQGFTACAKNRGDGGGASVLRLSVLWNNCMKNRNRKVTHQVVKTYLLQNGDIDISNTSISLLKDMMIYWLISFLIYLCLCLCL